MAINVDNVYKTVLLVLNQEQRGYITPDEFNKTATQVQLDIFEKYFEDLNQQLRVTQADFDYSNRQINIDDRISNFKCIGSCNYGPNSFALPVTDDLTNTTIVYDDSSGSNQFSFYRLGTVTFNDIEVQRLQRVEFYNIDRSDLTAPSENFPVYLYESGKLSVKPTGITTNVKATFLRKPKNVNWGYSVGSLGQYIYDATSSVNFELHPSEQVNVITNILLYSGIIIQDPTIIQVAAQKIQQEDINEKS